jgi:hypothetical protein
MASGLRALRAGGVGQSHIKSIGSPEASSQHGLGICSTSRSVVTSARAPRLLRQAFHVDRPALRPPWISTLPGIHGRGRSVHRAGHWSKHSHFHSGKRGSLAHTSSGGARSIGNFHAEHRDACVSHHVDDNDAYYCEWSTRVTVLRAPRDEEWGARTFDRPATPSSSWDQSAGRSRTCLTGGCGVPAANPTPD